MIAPANDNTSFATSDYDMTLIVIHGRLYIISDATYKPQAESDGMLVYETDTLVLYLNEQVFYHKAHFSNNVIKYEIYDMGDDMQVADQKYVMKDTRGNIITGAAMGVNGRAYILSEAICIFVGDTYDRDDSSGWWVYKTPTLNIFVDVYKDNYRFYEIGEQKYESIIFTHSNIICTHAKGC